MAADSKIEWTDHTFNPWIGCTKVSIAATGGGGCDHCYAEVSTPVRVLRGKGAETWGTGAPRVRTSAANWALPKRWNAQHEAFFAQHGRRQRVFCASLADVFDNAVDPQWRADLFALIRECENLDCLLLTKRIGNAADMLPWQGEVEHWPHVWLGATVVNQAEADRDIPKLLAVPAAKRFLSMEPLLGPVDITEHLWGRPKPCHDCPKDADCECGYTRRGFFTSDPKLGWVIVGGESGPNARPMHPDWARSLRDQCANAGVPFLFKQWGEWAPTAESPVHPEATRIPGNLCRVQSINAPDRYVAISFDAGRKRYEIGRVGKKAAGRLLDGREWNEVPR